MKCRSCGLEKDPSLFYKSDLKTCKECIKLRVRNNRKEKAEYYKEYDKQRANNPERVAARKLYQSSENGKFAVTRAKKRWLENNPKKRAVHIQTGNAIRDGILAKSPCNICGCSDVVAHHEDYDKPLEITWLCPKHHSEWHTQNGEGKNPI